MQAVQHEENLIFLTSGVGVTIFSSLGLIGNAMSLLVLCRKEMHSSFNCLLQGLAVFDSLQLLASLLVEGLRWLYPKVPVLRYYSMHLFPTLFWGLYAVLFICQTGTTWSTVCVSVESVGYNVPRFLDIKLTEEFDNSENTTYWKVGFTDFYTNEQYKIVYDTWLYNLILFVIPFLLLSVLNGAIIRAVRVINKSRQCLGENVRREINLVSTLLAVVAVFFFCNVMALVLRLVHSTNAFLWSISNMLIIFNSSINFIIYCLFGRKFRHALVNMLCRSSMGSLLQKIIVRTIGSGELSLTDISTISITSGGEPRNNSQSEVTISRL